MSERVILVDERDHVLGSADKLEAHADGRLHRAFSVFVFNDAGELLLQRRSWGKYHSGGLWSNSCCSHPRPGETVVEAAHRRLPEEMGFDCDLEPAGHLLYRAEVGGGLVENEFDHLLIGHWNGTPRPDPGEAAGWRWVPIPRLQREVTRSPHRFTYWCRAALRLLEDDGWLAPRRWNARVA